MFEIRKRAVRLLAFLGLPAALAAQPECTPVPTGENATIILPVAAAPQLDGAPLPIGTEIQAGALRNGQWFCAGKVIWEAENTALIAYGEDGFTEGLQGGEAYRFRALLPGGCLADSVSVIYEDSPGFQAGIYQADGISLVASLQAYTIKAEVNVLAPSCPGNNNGEAEVGLTIGGTLPYSYNWSGGQSGAVVGSLPPGPFSITLTDATGCADTLFGAIETAPLPIVQLPPDTVLCDADSLAIAPLFLDADSIIWSTGEMTAAILADGSGWYQLLAFSAEGCPASDSIRVDISSLPASFLADSVFWCQEDSLLLEAMPPTAPYTYQWSDGANGPFTWAFAPGNYSLTVTDALGCRRQDAIQVAAPPPLEIGLMAFPSPACPGDTVEVEASGGENYLWLFPEDAVLISEGGNWISLAIRESFIISAVASNDCNTDTAMLAIPVQVPAGAAGPDTCVLAGQPVRLFASGGVAYFWESDKYEIEGPLEDTIKVNPMDSTLFLVTITDAAGCSYQDSVKVLVVENTLLTLKPISVISPNGDGKNDVLEFPGLEKFPQNELTIFNRWGTVVFQKRGYQKDSVRWDGTYKGKELPVSVYYYSLSIGEAQLKQTLSLIR
ncbi:MAG: gliding motility-associated C-terminal domain-containing protein [Lewinellaceae bacterium]|nr:gliding motility-associated C-terminal domain-containing protein [Phaeodactylibacter sp.]MCB9350734.1 gliding motility-associated C-terminal domain-containing protein [Lewinellaceae bacterium]